MPTIDHYYNRFDPEKDYTEVLFREEKPVQGSEHNEVQHILKGQLKGVADALFVNGTIINDAAIVVNPETGAVQAEKGQIYIAGAVRNVPAAEFTVPIDGIVSVGVYLLAKTISELEDPALYNPHRGGKAEGEPGAWRKQEKLTWGHANDGSEGDFYPVYTVEYGVLKAKSKPADVSGISQGIASYDRDSTGGGSYVVDGLTVQHAQNVDSTQIYTVLEGKARVNGFGVEQVTSRRVAYPTEPDERYIETEIHTATGEEQQRVNVAQAPIKSIDMLRVTLRKTVDIVHGAYTGAADTLPDTAVVSIEECKQGSVIYDASAYKKKGDKVDWSPAGAEPTGGSTYQCTYTYMATVQAEEQDFDGFTVTGAVADSSIIVSYNQALPRIDRLCLTIDGQYEWIQGVAATANPKAPQVPESMLCLATISQEWRGKPHVTNDGVRVVPFEEIKDISSRLDYALREISRQRLESDAATRDAGARVGIFVDPLLDDSQRDQGIDQTAAVVDGCLMLPMSADIGLLADLTAPAMANIQSYRTLVEQTLRTDDIRVNPYSVFDPLPAQVTLTPAIDQWTDTNTSWTSAITRNITTGRQWSPWTPSRIRRRTISELVSSTETEAEFLRQIQVSFSVKGFAAGEEVSKVLFDGIEVPTTPESITANDAGELNGSFTIPANIPVGAKTVEIYGGSESPRGTAVFIGSGKITSQTFRQVSVVETNFYDPVAQTFVLDSPSPVAGVDLWFAAKGGDVRVQVRSVQNGYPTRQVLAEKYVSEADINVDGTSTRILFDTSVFLSAATEYAFVVMCDDATTAIHVATIGQFDTNAQKWVTSQPYTVGVMFTSSNASTWTAHQDQDVAFRLLGPQFITDQKTVDLGSYDVDGATDLMVFCLDETPTSGTRVEYELGLPGGEKIVLAPNQPVSLPEAVTGTVTARAKLIPTREASPLVWPGGQLLAGQVSQTADYCTRAIPANNAAKCVLVFNAVIPSGSGIAPKVQLDTGQWQEMELISAVPQGDGLAEYTYSLDVSGAEHARAKLDLSGTTTARPWAEQIRFLAVA